MAKTLFVPGTTAASPVGIHPKIEITPPFVLVFSPGRYGVLAGRLVPMPGKQPLVAGVNGISQAEDGTWQLRKWRVGLAEAGRLEIPWSWGPDGSYLAELDTQHGRGVVTTYVSTWEDAGPGDTQTDTDLEGYSAWLEGLVAAGRLPPCPVSKIRRMIKDKRQILLRDESDQQRKPSGSRAQRIEAFKKELEVLEAALKARGPRARKPRKRTPKKAAAVPVAAPEEN